MDRLWTPWRYEYITGESITGAGRQRPGRKGVPAGLADWPGPAAGEPEGCVFCNLIGAVRWAIDQGMPPEQAEREGNVVARLEVGFVCLNAFPYSSGHLLIVPYRHTDTLAALSPDEAAWVVRTAQHAERALRAVYRPDGINMGLNLGEAAGAGVASHMHLHALPRWFGDTSFMTVVAETRTLPETLDSTWKRIRSAWPV